MDWTKGENDAGQMWAHPTHDPAFQVVRNRGERHWVIYDLHPGTACMVPNPRPGRFRLEFAEVTDIPAAGESFGDRPHHDTIPGPRAPRNYAWDSAAEAMAYVETLLR